MSDQDNIALFGDRVARLTSTRNDPGPRGAPAWGPKLNLGKIVLFVALCLALKGLVIAYVSEGTYRTYLLYLGSDTVTERLLGAVLAPDPVSLRLSRYLSL